MQFIAYDFICDYLHMSTLLLTVSELLERSERCRERLGLPTIIVRTMVVGQLLRVLRENKLLQSSRTGSVYPLTFEEKCDDLTRPNFTKPGSKLTVLSILSMERTTKTENAFLYLRSLMGR